MLLLFDIFVSLFQISIGILLFEHEYIRWYNILVLLGLKLLVLLQFQVRGVGVDRLPHKVRELVLIQSIH